MEDREVINFIHIPKNAGTSIEKFIKKNKKLNIIYHGHDAKISSLENQMIILRNPFERFCSAFQYTLEKYHNSPRTQKMIAANIVTPNDFVDAWSNRNHPHHKLVLEELKNGSHYVDGIWLPYKWTYSPQIHWINEEKAKYIINYENVEDYFLDKFRKKLPLYNSSMSHKNWKLSEKSKKFLRTIYKADFCIIKKYQNNFIMN